MKFVLPIILVAATVVLMALAIFGVGQSAGTVGIATGSALPGLGSKADTPEQAVGSFLTDIRRRNWDRAYSALSKTSGVDEPSFIQDWTGSNGSLRTFSSLETYEARPLHASSEGAVVMGEVVNEDTIPAFVNVNATLVDGTGKAIDDESSFDKIAHVLLPKQVSAYRIDFPNVGLKNVKNVRMDIKATLVPASADPVLGVMDQKVDPDVQGKSVLRGQLLNESGQTVNIPHVIASFYDNNGRVIWVSDGYVDRALLPQTSEPFAVEIPKTLASKV